MRGDERLIARFIRRSDDRAVESAICRSPAESRNSAGMTPMTVTGVALSMSCSADDVRIAAETPLPQTVANDGDESLRFGLIVFRE